MKELTITEERTIREIQNDFNNIYPFLKLEFFHTIKNSIQPYRMLNNSLKIGEVVYNLQEGAIHLSDEMPVSELESIFTDRFGLLVQVFRKSGNLWLETTMTDKWTLKNQNEHGREISSEIY